MTSRSALPFAVLVASLAVPVAARAQTTLMTEGGWAYDLNTDGTVQSGTTMGFIQPYAGCFGLTVNGSPYGGGSSTTSGDGRTVTFPESPVGSLRAQRIAYVPATGGDFIRYLDVVSNPGTSDATVTVAYTCRLDTFSESTVRASSSGDTTFGTDDDWVTTNDMFESYPALGFVLQGPGAMVRTSAANFDSSGFDLDTLTWSYTATVPAGGRATFVIFGTQKADMDDAGTMAESMRLVATPDDVMVGADAYLDSIVNFVEDVPNAPKIRFSGPTEVNEGDAIDVTLNVIDVGGPSTWSWDLNGDGTFGDMPGSTMYSVAAGTTDGPSQIRVGVLAMNGVAMAQRYRVVTVDNVAPMVSPPFPSTTTTNGADYHYQFVVTDPGGAMDPPNFRCTTCPSTMTLSATGYLQWTPGDLDVTMPMMPHHIVVSIDDGDLGTTNYAWDLSVLPDHPPTRPSIIFPNGIVVDPTPRLVASNSTDEDGDPLSYYFELDTVDTFDSPAHQMSPAVAQTDGYTAWRPTDLPMGTQWFWRVKANDTMVDSDWAMASFYTAGTAPLPDLGMPTPDAGTPTDASTRDAGGIGGGRGGCCAVAGADGGGASGLLLAAGLGALVAARRRRR